MVKPKKLKLKSGVKWEVVLYLNGRGSKRIKRRFKRKVDAEAFLSEFSGNANLPREQIVEKQIQRNFYTEADYWIKNKKYELSAAYYIRAVGILNSVVDMYGEVHVEKFNNAYLTIIRNKLLENDLSKATVNRWMTSIMSVLKYSYDNHRIDILPFRKFKLFKEVRDSILFWEKSEIKQFLASSKERHLNTNTEWVYIAYLLSLNTGTRSGELWGLKVKDISFERNLILIKRQFNKATGTLTWTKGKDSRSVPLNSEIAGLLIKYINASNKTEDDFIFTNNKGRPVSHDNFRKRQFLIDIEIANVRLIRFHDLRHTAITQMVAHGIALNVVQSIAGHKNIATTMRYVHVLGSSIESEANTFSLTV